MFGEPASEQLTSEPRERERERGEEGGKKKTTKKKKRERDEAGVFWLSLRSPVVHERQRGSCSLAQPGLPSARPRSTSLCSPLEPG